MPRAAARRLPPPFAHRVSTLGALAALAASAGCADIQRANLLAPDTINPASPVAEDARLASETTFKTPSFQNVPLKPAQMPNAKVFKGEVVAVVDQRRRIEAWKAAHPPMTDDTEPWAETQRGRIPKSASTPVASSHQAEADAFAEKLRRDALAPAKPQ